MIALPDHSIVQEYRTELGVAYVRVFGGLEVGARAVVYQLDGHRSAWVSSMQDNHQEISSATDGQRVAIRLTDAPPSQGGAPTEAHRIRTTKDDLLVVPKGKPDRQTANLIPLLFHSEDDSVRLRAARSLGETSGDWPSEDGKAAEEGKAAFRALIAALRSSVGRLASLRTGYQEVLGHSDAVSVKEQSFVATFLDDVVESLARLASSNASIADLLLEEMEAAEGQQRRYVARALSIAGAHCPHTLRALLQEDTKFLQDDLSLWVARSKDSIRADLAVRPPLKAILESGGVPGGSEARAVASRVREKLGPLLLTGPVVTKIAMGSPRSASFFADHLRESSANRMDVEVLLGPLKVTIQFPDVSKALLSEMTSKEWGPVDLPIEEAPAGRVDQLVFFVRHPSGDTKEIEAQWRPELGCVRILDPISLLDPPKVASAPGPGPLHCRLQIAGLAVHEVRLWRTLVRIVAVGGESEGVMRVVVPGWNPRETVSVRRADVPTSILSALRAGQRLYAHVDLAAEDADQLAFTDWELH